MFVFRVFEGISYALVMRVERPVKVGDRFQQPEELQLAAAEPRPAASAVPMAAPVVSPGPIAPRSITPTARTAEERKPGAAPPR
jgi:hypothetical protein